MAAATVRARLLGGFDLAVAGRPVPAAAFERPSGLRLLKLLLATPGHRVGREAAAEALWPEVDPERSSANLRKAIHFARRALSGRGIDGEAVLRSEGSELRLAHGWAVDVDELTAAIGAVEGRAWTSSDLETLARLGGEPLLPADPYDEWLEPIREQLRQRSLEALLAGSAQARAVGDRGTALSLASRALALEPAEERAHRLLIELHLEAGELHAARRQLQSCRRAVVETYGVEPDPALAALVADAAARRRAPADVGPPEAPILGRSRELDAAQASIDAVAAGARVGTVLLRGQAGIGKSRVLREIAGTVRAAGWPIVELRGVEDAVGAPFAAFAAALVGAIGPDLPGVAEPARSAVAFADPSSGEKPEVLFGSDAPVQHGLIAALVAVPPPGGPLAIVVDDAQWLDRSTLELLEALIGGSAHRRAVVVAAVRDEPALVAGPVSVLLAAVGRTNGVEVGLGPLSAEEIRAVIERDVAGAPIADDVADAIGELSAGTPLYAADLFRSASETAFIEQRDGRWSFRRGVAGLQVPESIARLVERRIARMGPVPRLVLATAAELGDTVAFDDLVDTGTGANEVLDAVDAAIAAGLVVERDGRYAFAHPLYRAALRRGLPPRDRASVHRRIAETFARGIDPRDATAIQRAGARGVDILAIATHAAAAVELGSRETASLAVGFGIGAGERQAYLFDFPGAVETLQRTLRLWQRMPADGRDGFPVSRAHVELGQALRRTGDDTGAKAAFEEAIATARDDDELATAASAASWLPYEHGRLKPALEILDAVAGRLSDPVARARIDSARGWIIGREAGWHEASAILAPAVAVLERAGPTPDLMRALDRLAIAYRDADAGRPDAAIPILERAIRMAIELGRTGERAAFELHLAGALLRAHRLDEATAALDRARGLSQLTGERYIESVVEWNAAEVEQARGDFAAAIRHRRRELEIFSDIGGNPRNEAMAHAHIAQLAGRLDEADLASAETEAARSLARHSGIDGLEARVDEVLATPDWFGA